MIPIIFGLMLVWAIFGFLIAGPIFKELEELKLHNLVTYGALFLLGPVCWIFGICMVYAEWADERKKKVRNL